MALKAAIPNTGPVSHSMIMAEWGKSGTFRLSNDGGPLISKTAGSQVKESDFRGKSSVPPTPINAGSPKCRSNADWNEGLFELHVPSGTAQGDIIIAGVHNAKVISGAWTQWCQVPGWNVVSQSGVKSAFLWRKAQAGDSGKVFRPTFVANIKWVSMTVALRAAGLQGVASASASYPYGQTHSWSSSGGSLLVTLGLVGESPNSDKCMNVTMSSNPGGKYEKSQATCNSSSTGNGAGFVNRHGTAGTASVYAADATWGNKFNSYGPFCRFQLY